MSQQQILVLGAIAGLTIFIGLPAGRLRRLSTGASALLSATATGILLFLLWDVLTAAIEPVEAALNAAALDHDGTWARFAGLATIFVGCFAVGLMSLAKVASERSANVGPTIRGLIGAANMSDAISHDAAAGTDS